MQAELGPRQVKRVRARNRLHIETLHIESQPACNRPEKETLTAVPVE
jgi:hypothetical protein